MKIGELAKTTGCSIQSIRYYEKQKLLRSPYRSEGNFRLYNQASLEQLQFIKLCRSLDLTLAEIRHLIGLRESPSTSCNDVNLMVDAHIDQVDLRIRELRSLQKLLKQLRQKCSANRTVKDCGILDDLSAK